MTISPRLLEQTFEARYEKGYRYLDRCGDAMCILEDILSKDTGRVWMPDEMKPTGARMKCPETETVVVFDSSHLVVTRGDADVGEDEFASICVAACAAILPRLAIEEFVRVGARKKYLFGEDDIASAERASVAAAPSDIWPGPMPEGFVKVLVTHTREFARSDRSEGVRVSLAPFFRVGAPAEVDDRLRLPPHLLDTKQREALLEQLRLRRKRESNPDAGLLCDIDYYRTRPKHPDFAKFLEDAWVTIEAQLACYRK